MSDNDSSFGAFLAGFLVGGLVGAAAAFILAPQSGKETRSQITGKGHDMVDATEQRYQSAVDSVETYAQQVSERVSAEVDNLTRIVLDEGLESAGTADENGSAASAAGGDEAASSV